MPHVVVEAANKSDVTLLKVCLSGELGAICTDDLCEALLRAANNGNVECVSELLAHGVPVDTPDPDHDTPLMLAASNNRAAVLQVLLKAGADVNLVSDYGRTALHMACWNGHGHLVRELLSVGTDPSIPDQYGDTALMLAAHNGHASVVQLLLESYHPVNMSNHDNDTALHYAAKKDHRQVVKLLIEAGAERNATNSWGASPLFLAVETNSVEAVRYLLSAKADCNLTGGKVSKTPMHSAATWGYKDCVELLLTHDAYPDLKDSNGYTPLMYAVFHHHKAIVSLLVKAGANVDYLESKLPTHKWLDECELMNIYVTQILVASSSQQLFANSLLKYIESSGLLSHCERTWQWLKQYTNQPEPLIKICRREIRRTLQGRMHSSYGLPLPLTLKAFLNMYDIV